MKRLSLLFLCGGVIFCSGFLTACSDDQNVEDNIPNRPSHQTPTSPTDLDPTLSIVGEWTSDREYPVVECEPNDVKDAFEAFLVEEYTMNEEEDITFIFRPDGSFKIDNRKYAEITEGTYTVEGDILTIVPQKVTPEPFEDYWDDDYATESYTINIQSDAFSLSIDETQDSKRLANEERTWREIEMEKPAGFKIIKSTRVHSLCRIMASE